MRTFLLSRPPASRLRGLAGACLLLLLGAGPGVAQSSNYCASGLGGFCGGNDMTDVSIPGTSLNATSLACANTGGQAYAAYPASGPNTATLVYGVPYTLRVTLTGTSAVAAWVDFNHNFVFEAGEWTPVTTSSPANGSPATATLLVPASAVQGSTTLRLRSVVAGSALGAADACALLTTGETKDFTVTIGPPAACPAVAGLAVSNISASSAAVSFTAPAAGTAYTLTLTPAGGTPTTRTVSASPVLLTGLAPSTAYTASMVASCGPGQTSAASTTTFRTGCPAAPYATVNNTTPYTQDFEANWLSPCDTAETPGLNWRNTPVTGSASWRRDDDGATAGWSPALGVYTPAGSPLGAGTSAHSARFHSYEASSGATGSLDLSVNMAGTSGTPTLTFDYLNTDGSDSLQVQVSVDGGATFAPALARFATASSWTAQTVSLPATGLSATTVIRLQATSDFGISDMGLDNVGVSYVVCPAVTGLAVSSVSASGAAVSFTSPAAATAYTLTLTPAGGTPTTRTVSASPVLLTGLAPSTAYTASMVASCGPGLSSAPAIARFTTTCGAAPYVAVTNTTPYTQDFETAWLSQCNVNDLPALNWRNTPATGNASWRRDDDGATAGWSSLMGVYTPAGSPLGSGTSAHSARFHTYNAMAGAVGSLDLSVNMAGTSGTPTLTFDYLNTDGSDSLQVQVSVDGGATFAPALARFATASSWTDQTVSLPATGLSATTVIRLQATSDFGYTDIGVDNVGVSYVACPAVTGLAVSSVSASGAAVSFTSPAAATAYTLTLTPAGGTPTTRTVSASPVLLTGLAPSTAYTVSMVASCGPGLSSLPAQKAFVTSCLLPAYATLPITEGFENTWLSRCGNHDAPSNSWRNTPIAGDSAWRREDDGASAGWITPTASMYTPTGSLGAHSARFHSSFSPRGQTGTLDLFVDLSPAGFKRLSFDYLNTDGDDSLQVQLSTDGGTTFTRLAGYTTSGASAAFATHLLAIGSTSATAVLRFRGWADSGGTDMGLDNIVLETVNSCLTPVALTDTTTTTTAVLSWLAGGTGTYAVVYGPLGFNPTTGGTTVSGLTAPPLTITGLAPGTTYQYYVTLHCAAGASSGTAGPYEFTTQLVNDEPCGARTLLVNSSCTPLSATTLRATTTASTVYDQNGQGTTCGHNVGPLDVWFKFTTAATGPTSTQVRISVTGGAASVVKAYSGSACAGPLTYLSCTGTSNNTSAPDLDLNSLLPSTTYYVRVSEYSSFGGVPGSFTICATQLPSCPAPSGLSAGTVTGTSAALSWLAPAAGGSTFSVIYGLAGFVPPAGGTVVTGIGTNSTTLTGLTPDTAYGFYVQQVCAGA
ncbi:fibronectin type III domain-containing protein, partial [Hymenobacter terricola]|uniref:fibronectin type III domain-containing protein n=1 Tax=Hymenobacter terricola TaxID=2819236 RepID=UPI001CF4CEF5